MSDIFRCPVCGTDMEELNGPGDLECPYCLAILQFDPQSEVVKESRNE